jgi:hypothetical protein
MAMHPRDLHPDRSLDKSWDLSSAADGRARSPAELLDNLRLRLSQLPENHPSALRDTSDVQRGAANWDDGARSRQHPGESLRDWPRGRQASAELSAARDDKGWPDFMAPHDKVSPPGFADESRRSAEASADAHDDGSPPSGGSLADLFRAARDACDALAESADAGVLGDIEVFPGNARYDPYRPWFMSAEPLTPWFAVGDGL